MIFVFFLSLAIWKDSFSWIKLMTITVAIEGVVIIALTDNET